MLGRSASRGRCRADLPRPRDRLAARGPPPSSLTIDHDRSATNAKDAANSPPGLLHVIRPLRRDLHGADEPVEVVEEHARVEDAVSRVPDHELEGERLAR